MGLFSKDKPGQVQEQLQVRLKGLDDVFHNVIIALERLELFIEHQRAEKSDLQITAINSDRDLHDDGANPPTLNSLHAEINTQCLALFYQTNFDKDKEVFQEVLQYFLEDIFTWYGGRNESIPPSAVEKYFLPITAALSRQVKTASEVSQIIKSYVIDIGDISQLSEGEKEKAVLEGFTALNKAHHITEKRMKVFMDKLKDGAEFEFSGHSRGTTTEGIKRLLISFIDMYDAKTPADRLIRLATNHFPDSKNDIIEVLLNQLFNQKQQ